MSYGRLGDLFVLLRYPERLQGSRGEFAAQTETPQHGKMKDWRTLILQYLLQQNRSITGDNKPVYDEKERKRCGGMPLLTGLALMMRVNPLVLIFALREFVAEARFSSRAGKGVQTLGPVREPCIGSGFFRAELGERTGTEKTGERG